MNPRANVQGVVMAMYDMKCARTGEVIKAGTPVTYVSRVGICTLTDCELVLWITADPNNFRGLSDAVKVALRPRIRAAIGAIEDTIHHLESQVAACGVAK